MQPWQPRSANRAVVACAITLLALAVAPRPRAQEAAPPGSSSTLPIHGWKADSARVVAVDQAGAVWTEDGLRHGKDGTAKTRALRLRQGSVTRFDGIASDGRERVLGTRAFAHQTTEDADIGTFPARAGYAEIRGRDGSLAGELGWSGGGGAFTIDLTDVTQAGVFVIAGLTASGLMLSQGGPLRWAPPPSPATGCYARGGQWAPYALALDARGRVRWSAIAERLGASRHLALDRRAGSLAVGGVYSEKIDLDPAPGSSHRHQIRSLRPCSEVEGFVSVLSIEKRGRFTWGCALVGERQSAVQGLAFDGRGNLWILALVSGGRGPVSLMCPEPAGALRSQQATGRVLMAVAPPGKLVFAEELMGGDEVPDAVWAEGAQGWRGGPALVGRAQEGVLLYRWLQSGILAYDLRGRRWAGDVGNVGTIDRVWEGADGAICAGVSKWDTQELAMRSRVGCFEPLVPP
jgi:hypothetical protein